MLEGTHACVCTVLFTVGCRSLFPPSSDLRSAAGRAGEVFMLSSWIPPIGLLSLRVASLTAILAICVSFVAPMAITAARPILSVTFLPTGLAPSFILPSPGSVSPVALNVLGLASSDIILFPGSRLSAVFLTSQSVFSNAGSDLVFTSFITSVPAGPVSPVTSSRSGSAAPVSFSARGPTSPAAASASGPAPLVLSLGPTASITSLC